MAKYTQNDLFNQSRNYHRHDKHQFSAKSTSTPQKVKTKKRGY